MDVLLKRFLKLAGVGGEEEVVVEEEEAEGGERESARREEVWVFVSILTERAPSSRTWDYPAAASPSPRPAPPNRRGSRAPR